MVATPEHRTASDSVTAPVATEPSQSPRSGAAATTEPADAPEPGESDVLDELVAALDSLHKAYRPSAAEEPELPGLTRRLVAALSEPGESDGNDDLEEPYDDSEATAHSEAPSGPLEEMLPGRNDVPRLPAPSDSQWPPATSAAHRHSSGVGGVSRAPPPLQATARSLPGRSIVPVGLPALPSRMLTVTAPAFDFGQGGAVAPNTAIGFSAGFALAMAVGAALYACLLTF